MNTTKPEIIRYDIVQKGTGEIFVRVTNEMNGATMMISERYFKTLEDAQRWLRDYKIELRRKEKAREETILVKDA